jgi:hypothetical protein
VASDVGVLAVVAVAAVWAEAVPAPNAVRAEEASRAHVQRPRDPVMFDIPFVFRFFS